MPASPSDSPSRAGSSVPCPLLPQPTSAAVSASTQAAAVVLAGRRIGARILGTCLVARAPGPRGVHPGVRPEPGRLERLVAGHADARERALGRILEPQPQTLERHLRVAPYPARGAGLPEPVQQRGRLAVGAQLDVGEPAGLLH